MTSDEIEEYIRDRYGELSSDEILEVLDVDKNPQIDHVIREGDTWRMWDNTGREFSFQKRTWM